MPNPENPRGEGPLRYALAGAGPGSSEGWGVWGPTYVATAAAAAACEGKGMENDLEQSSLPRHNHQREKQTLSYHQRLREAGSCMTA